MADSINLPRGITDIVKVEVKDTSNPLRKFLIDLLSRVDTLERKVITLENKVKELS